MGPPDPKHSSRDEAVGLLAPALGKEKAHATVDAAASALGLASLDWSPAQFRSVLAQIALESGLVGITARVVSRRLRFSSDMHVAVPGPAPGAAGPGARGVGTAQKSTEAIIDLLAQALGADLAAREVGKAVRALGCGDHVSFSQALTILEHMAHEPGLVGIAAQFAKTRLHLLTW